MSIPVKTRNVLPHFSIVKLIVILLYDQTIYLTESVDYHEAN